MFALVNGYFLRGQRPIVESQCLLLEWYTFKLSSIWLHFVTLWCMRFICRSTLSTLDVVHNVLNCTALVIVECATLIPSFLYHNKTNTKAAAPSPLAVASWRWNGPWTGRWYISLFAFVAAHPAKWFCYACQQARHPLLQQFDQRIAQVSRSLRPQLSHRSYFLFVLVSMQMPARTQQVQHHADGDIISLGLAVASSRIGRLVQSGHHRLCHRLR